MFIENEVFKATAGVIIFIAVYVIYKINIGGLNTVDAAWICFLRNAGFVTMAGVLGWAIWEDASRRSLLGLFYSGAWSMVVNALALYFRK